MFLEALEFDPLCSSLTLVILYFCRVDDILSYDQHRLDVKAQKIDRGYPRFTDAVFGGVPYDAHDVFQYKGK